jgi:hypothetical protein
MEARPYQAHDLSPGVRRECGRRLVALSVPLLALLGLGCGTSIPGARPADSTDELEVVFSFAMPRSVPEKVVAACLAEVKPFVVDEIRHTLKVRGIRVDSVPPAVREVDNAARMTIVSQWYFPVRLFCPNPDLPCISAMLNSDDLLTTHTDLEVVTCVALNRPAVRTLAERFDMPRDTLRFMHRFPMRTMFTGILSPDVIQPEMEFYSHIMLDAAYRAVGLYKNPVPYYRMNARTPR